MIWSEPPPSPTMPASGSCDERRARRARGMAPEAVPVQPRKIATGFDMIETLQTPWITDVRRLPSRNRGRGVEPLRIGAMRLGAPTLHPANSLFGRTNSLFGQKHFPVSGRTGNWLQAVESA